MGRHTKFDPQAAPLIKGPRATPDWHCYSAHSVFCRPSTPKHGQEQRSAGFNGRVSCGTGPGSCCPNSCKNCRIRTNRLKEVVIRMWLVWQCRLRLPNSTQNVSFHEILDWGRRHEGKFGLLSWRSSLRGFYPLQEALPDNRASEMQVCCLQDQVSWTSSLHHRLFLIVQ